MKIASLIILSAACLQAGYQPTVTDGLTSINSTKWTRIGNLSAGSNGVTGEGSLISTVAIPTGADYDMQMTIHTAQPGLCTGSYSLYARSTPDNSTAYVLNINGGNVGLFKKAGNVWTELSWLPYYCADGTVMRLVARGANLTIWSGPNMATYTDPSPITAGQPGVGISASGDSIGSVQIGPIDYFPPTAINASSVESSTAGHRVDLRWPASTADANSAGMQGYAVYRDGIYLGSSRTPTYTDQTVTPGEKTTYSLYAVDQHGNVSAPAQAPIIVPGGAAVASTTATAVDHLGRPVAKTYVDGPTVDQFEVGVRPNGSYWGAAGENIDMLSGNLNYTIPLMKGVSRANLTAPFGLSYNSQMWRQESNGSVWLLGEDLGFGLGWKFQAGSILPIWSNGIVIYYIYEDSTAAQYYLDTNNGSNVWNSSLDGVYAWYDANANMLHFPDGSFWPMTVQSEYPEPDAGTLYPQYIVDSNGNQISITYTAAAGQLGGESSSRIGTIGDSRTYPSATYELAYTNGIGAVPHLYSIAGIDMGGGYWPSFQSPSLVDPFTSSSFGTVPVLSALQLPGLSTQYSFGYDTSGELTSATNPLGGFLGWGYSNTDYTARNYREVNGRYVSNANGYTDLFYINNYPFDGFWNDYTVVSDSGAGTAKVWSFSTNSDYTAGLASGYQEMDSSGNVSLQKGFAWTNSHPNPYYGYGVYAPNYNIGSQYLTGPPYIGSLYTTLNPGTGGAATTQAQQIIDSNGNLTRSQIFDYPSGATATRTYTYTYLGSAACFPYGDAYAAAYILNPLCQAQVGPGTNGTQLTLAQYGHDQNLNGITFYGTYSVYSDPCPAMQQSNAGNGYGGMYIPGYGPRGNATTSTGVNGADFTCTAYDNTGVPFTVMNANGLSVGIQTSSDSNYSLPGVITPNGNSDMQTSATYATSWSATSLTGPNGAQGTTTYDSYGRPSKTTIPDGAVTTYTYTYYNPSTGTGANTQTATIDSGRWQTTTLDGFGRVIKVQKGSGSTTVSEVDTNYGPCACSPLGKVVQVSQPYAPGSQTPVWTTYTYDASGRPLTVTAPDGASITTYSYSGNSTTVTDPAGKWKTTTKDTFGNVTQVTEPNPAGGNLVTCYTYTLLNQVATVSMGGSSCNTATQTRTFTYSGLDLVNATNPENGTVTYTYDSYHHVLSRTDAKGQYTQYTYDAYGRLTGASYFPQGSGGPQDSTQYASYGYDWCQNGVGYLCSVSFGSGVTTSDFESGYSYSYTYNTAGRVVTQTNYVGASSGNGSTTLAEFASTYAWDDEGRMTSMQYPTVTLQGGGQTALQTAGYVYDTNGRMTQMTWNSGSGPQTYANASYNAAGQLLTLGYNGVSETRGYNAMGQMISQYVPGYLNMAYNYSSSQNNGRVIGVNDYVTGENTSYTYDSLNRLTNASNSLWSESYTYDVFGNLTQKSGSGCSPVAAPSMGPVTYNGNNRLTTGTYDANGNLTAANNATIGYSMDNRMNTQSSNAWLNPLTNYGYDPWGKRVMQRVDPDPYSQNQGSNPTWQFYFYSITGQKLVTVSCNNAYLQNQWPTCTLVGENVYFGKKLLVSNGVTVVTDRLGSVRANTQGESFAYYPYGEERDTSVNGREKFGTYFRDGVGQDYAEQRYYNSSMGRFWTADPGGVKSADASTSLGWNMYAYVQGDPINHRDRYGREVEAPDEGGCDPNLDCGPPGCYDPGNEFLGQPDPGCQTGGGGDPDPPASSTPAPPTCDQLEAEWIDDYLQSYRGATGQGSPLYMGLGTPGTPGVDAGTYLVSLADSTGIDPAFILGIARAESSLGTIPKLHGGKYNVYGNRAHFTSNLYTNYFNPTQDAFDLISSFLKAGVGANTTSMYEMYVYGHYGTIPGNLRYLNETDVALFGSPSNIHYTCGATRVVQLDSALGIQ